MKANYSPESIFPVMERRLYSYSEINKIIIEAKKKCSIIERSADNLELLMQQTMIVVSVTNKMTSCIQKTIYTDLDYNIDCHFFSPTLKWIDLEFKFTREGNPIDPQLAPYTKNIHKEPQQVKAREAANKTSRKIPISYAKVIKTAFDSSTDINIARHYCDILLKAKKMADQAEMPITFFARFSLNSRGKLNFSYPIEYNPKADFHNIQKVLREQFHLSKYNGEYLSNLSIEHCKKILKQVRLGNYKGCNQ